MNSIHFLVSSNSTSKKDQGDPTKGRLGLVKEIGAISLRFLELQTGLLKPYFLNLSLDSSSSYFPFQHYNEVVI
jgi:hypothetical protein